MSPSDLLKLVARHVRKASVARIGSAQRREHADVAWHAARELVGTEHAAAAISAALLATMVAGAWNENKATLARRRRWYARQVAKLMANEASRAAWLQAGEASGARYRRDDFDADCARTYSAANELRRQAQHAARELEILAQMR